MVLSPESITWPEMRCIQMLALEGFKGHNTTFIESWNRYIESNKHRMNIRFIRSVIYPLDLRIRNGTKSSDIALNLNQSTVNDLRSSIGGPDSDCDTMWTLELDRDIWTTNMLIHCFIVILYCLCGLLMILM